MNESRQVTVVPTEPSDFQEWKDYLGLFHAKYASTKDNNGSLVKTNYIFSCNYEKDKSGNQLGVKIRRSSLEEHGRKTQNIFCRGFFRRSEFPKSGKGLKDAIAVRPRIMAKEFDDNMTTIDELGINLFKQVELAFKYKRLLPDNLFMMNCTIPPPRRL